MSGGGLVRYDAMRRRVAECVRIDEAAQIRDKAAALTAYARQRDDKELEAWVAEIKCRATIQIGRLSRELDKAERTRTDLHPASRKQTKTAALDEAGISTSSAHEYEQLADADDLEPTRAETYYADCKATGVAPTLGGLRQALKKDRRSERERKLAALTVKAAQARGTKLYGVIYADPPWRFKPYSVETGMDRAADNHYPTLTIDDIAKMEPPAAPHCVLFMWATVPMIEHALSVMRAWGFEFRSLWTWEKVHDDEPHEGTGYWLRNCSEHVIIATRGEVPCPVMGDNPPSVIRAPRGKHSAKPEAFAQWIDQMFPNVPKLEMFARAHRDGWDSWGNEVGGTDQ
jgi:N6-adenosine-specific RNA methylase IME4